MLTNIDQGAAHTPAPRQLRHCWQHLDSWLINQG